MKVGMEVGLGPSHIMLDEDAASPPKRSTAAPGFRPLSIVAKWSPISATAEHLFHYCANRSAGKNVSKVTYFASAET